MHRDEILNVDQLTKTFRVRQSWRKYKDFQALKGISFSIQKQKTLGLVGESGCGKSTLARILVDILQPNSGTITIEGIDRSNIDPEQYRKKIQMIFQDPYASINPRKNAGAIIAEPLVINSNLQMAEIRDRVQEMMSEVGLRPEYYQRYAHMFSGGQRQRIGIARALMMNPTIMVCDEPVSALDVSIQAQVLNLLMKIQDLHELSYLFISHDLSVVRHIADDIIVMYLGEIVERGTREQVFYHAKHPYTQALLQSTPNIKASNGDSRKLIQGELLASKANYACSFYARCPLAVEACKEIAPPVREAESGHMYSCHVVK
ncbi:MAG: dipeptide ABC transporter ATP-binding protein [Bdellovibrionales bacterium]|nr:dipeptide ABC transporter ATP-binding protein [Bdellovibrionales bacterium]